jgi:uncharacterized protein YciI
VTGTAAAHFVVVRRHGAPWDRSRPLEGQVLWNEHAEFMDELVAEGFVVIGGPLADRERALLIVAAEDEDAVRARLAEDPWSGNGLLELESVEGLSVRLDARQLSA